MWLALLASGCFFLPNYMGVADRFGAHSNEIFEVLFVLYGVPY
jgi:hypothetical protein